MFKNAKAMMVVALAGVFGLLAGPAHAVGAFDALTTAVTFTDVIAAVMAVAAILAALYVAMRGVVLILGFIRRG